MDSRMPMSIEESRFLCGLGCYPVCPYCKLTLDREYQHFCDRCGQELDWKDYSKAMPCSFPCSTSSSAMRFLL